MKRMNRWIKGIVDLIYPAECHLCGNQLGPDERFICGPCIETLPRTGYHRMKKNPMEERFAGQFPFEGATGHFFYTRDSSLAQLIQDLKYRGFPSIGDKIGQIAGEELFMSGFTTEIDYIVPLPMHFYKQARRGYNQTDRIAAGIGKATGLPVAKALKMNRERKTQTSLSKNERMKNADNLFSPRKRFDFNDKGVLLVDDICTTGATMGSAAKTLTDNFPGIRLYLFALGITF